MIYIHIKEKRHVVLRSKYDIQRLHYRRCRHIWTVKIETAIKYDLGSVLEADDTDKDEAKIFINGRT